MEVAVREKCIMRILGHMEEARQGFSGGSKVRRVMQAYRARQLLLVIGVLVLMLIQDKLKFHRPSFGSALVPAICIAEAAVTVQRLSVPELIVIDQFNQQLQPQAATRQLEKVPSPAPSSEQPEAQRLTNSDYHHNNNNNLFDCLISYQPDKDSNLVVKWYHDDRPDAIYQWIPELHTTPSIAPHYKPYIVPLVRQQEEPQNVSGSDAAATLRAAFKLVRPSKDFNGKYKCVATSSQNDDSKWKKMVVFTPPSNFRFNVSRVESLGGSLSRQQQQQQHQAGGWRRPMQQQPSNQMPIVYRLKGFEVGGQASSSSSTRQQPSDYVNLSQQRSRFRSASPQSPSESNNNNNNNMKQPTSRPALKLVCDIDQVFPLPEVTIYRLAKADGSHPDRLANQEAQRQRNPISGLYSVQVSATLDEDELSRIQPRFPVGSNSSSAAAAAAEPIYFECLIALSELQLSKYDNKRTILFRPEALQASEDITGTSAATTLNSTNTHQSSLLLLFVLITSLCFLLPLHLTGHSHRSLHLAPPFVHLSHL